MVNKNHYWSRRRIVNLLQMPFNDLVYRAHRKHRKFHRCNEVQISALLSVKTGGCPEDCKYCPQSIHYNTEVNNERLLSVDEALAKARVAKDKGVGRFCLGAAWRRPNQRNLDEVARMISGVKSLGLETCATLGMLSERQARQLYEAGLDFYNHNLDTSPEFYGNIISTRTYQDRLQTLKNVRKEGIKLCCGGIIGMGEGVNDRAGLLFQLCSMTPHPESVPINLLIRVRNTPLQDVEDLDPIEFVRTIAATRILMPGSYVRLSAGREQMSDEMQALCFFAGANSIFAGEKLLTAKNPDENRDRSLFARLGLECQGINM